MTQEILISVAASALVSALTASLIYRQFLVIAIRYSLLRRSKNVRVSIAAILRIAFSDNAYLLIRNLHRRESYVPLGGVYKYYDSARATLDKFGFRPHRTTSEHAAEMANDLRGFVSGRDLIAFLHWFRSGKDRENTCLEREIQEELREIGLTELADRMPTLRLQPVRTIREHTPNVPGQQYSQFRLIEVFDLAPTDTDMHEFAGDLGRAATRCDAHLVVTAEEIMRGRSKTGSLIAAHTPYLLGRTTPLAEPPGF
jgi:hypothetical protein